MILPDYTIPDADWNKASPPAPIALDTSQYGARLNAGPPKIYTQEQVWFHDPTIRRIGNYGVRVTSFHDSAERYNSDTLGCRVAFSVGPGPGVNAGVGAVTAGDEEWVGSSYYFPANWPGTGSWGGILEFGSGAASTHPSYGAITFDVHAVDTFRLRIKTGKTPPPGSADFNPILPPNGNGYNVFETLLGTGGPRPFTKDVWHDFYWHIVYQAYAPGLMEIWHREQGGNFEKIYSNQNNGTALINRAPHATMYWNTAYGYPGEGAAGGFPNSHGIIHYTYMMYRGAGPSDTNHDTIHWQDGPFRRSSQQAILNVFAQADVPTAPTISGFAPTSGTAGVTSVTISGTNFTGASAVRFNGVAATYNVDSAVQITATCPAGATTGKIQVTTAAGTGTSVLDFTVGATPPPDLPNPAANHLRIGVADIGTSQQTIGSNLKRVIRRGIGSSETVTIDKAYAWLTGPPPATSSQSHQVVIYDDDAPLGLPGSLLGMSDTLSVPSGQASSWIPFNFSTPVVATGDQIYFGLIESGVAEGRVGATPLSGAGWLNSDIFVDGPSNPFGSATVINLEPSVVVDYTITTDTRAPVFLAANVSSQVLTLTYDESLDPASIPASSAFSVTVNQQPWTLAPTVSIGGVQVFLTLAAPIFYGDIVTIAYTQPGTSDIQDAFGNKAASFAARSVDNQTQQIGGRVINPGQRVAVARRIDPSSRRAGEGGGL